MIFKSTDPNLPVAVRAMFETLAKAEPIRRDVTLAVKAFDPTAEMVIEGIANYAAPDRWREVIAPQAWRLDQYKKNPLVLLEHRRDCPIGTGEVFVKDDGLHCRAVIGNPKVADLTADQVKARSLIAQGILRAFSVGFIPKVWEWDEENEILKYTDVELLEFSVVAIPMQQDSMITSVKNLEAKTMEPKVNEIHAWVTTKSAADAAEIARLTNENATLATKLAAAEKEKAAIEEQAVALLDQMKAAGLNVAEVA